METYKRLYTSVEESKELLAIGVPEDSSDCFYSLWRGDVCADEPLGPFIRGTVSVIDYQNDIPCWSAGRLLEIIQTCYCDTATMSCDLTRDDKENFLKYLIALLRCNVNLKHIDFNKLKGEHELL